MRLWMISTTLIAGMLASANVTLPAAAATIVGFDGLCLDVTGAVTADNTRVEIYTCVPGAPNQQWSWTNKGQIVGIGGKCLDVTGANAAIGAQVAIYTCVDAAANEKWIVK